MLGGWLSFVSLRISHLIYIEMLQCLGNCYLSATNIMTIKGSIRIKRKLARCSCIV